MMKATWESMQDNLDWWWYLQTELDKLTGKLEALGCTFEDGAWVYSPELVARLEAAAPDSQPGEGE